MDSAVCLAEAKAAGFACHAISFDYGQRHRFELQAARRVAASIGVARHLVLSLDLRLIGGSALTADITVPKDRIGSADAEAAIPVTYVPARNTIFLSLALAWAETLGATDIYIGVNAIDYSGYPDCRPEFIDAFERMANLATRFGVEHTESPIKICTPLAALTKAGIVRRGRELGVDFTLTHSCYDPDPSTGTACGRCDACILRERGFRESGV